MNCWRIIINDGQPVVEFGFPVKEEKMDGMVFNFIDTPKFWVRITSKPEGGKTYGGEIRINALGHPYIVRNNGFDIGYDIILVESQQPVQYRLYGRGSTVLLEDENALLIKLTNGEVLQIGSWGAIRYGVAFICDKFEIVKALAS